MAQSSRLATVAFAAALLFLMVGATFTSTVSAAPAGESLDNADYSTTESLLAAGSAWAAKGSGTAVYVNWYDNWAAHATTDGISWGPWPSETAMLIMKLQITSMLESQGLSVVCAADIPEDLSPYSVMVILANYACEPSDVARVSSYINSGGGLVMVGATSEYFRCYCKNLDTRDLPTDPLSVGNWQWEGFRDFTTGGGSISTAIDNPFGLPIPRGTVIWTLPYADHPGVSGVVGTIVTLYSTGSSHATTNLYGSGRVYFQANYEPSATPTVPDPPTDLLAEPGDATVTVSWSAPANNGGLSLTGYRLYRMVLGGDYTLLAEPAETSYVDSGLTNGQTYWYKVSAVNAIGEGPMAGPVSAIPATLPTVPLDLQAASGNAQATLTWQAPASDGGSALLNYNLYRSTSVGGEYSLIATPSGTGYADMGLINGQTYWYKVSAVNAIGEGPLTDAASATPVTMPSVPLNLLATAGNAEILLTWQAPSNNGGSPVLGYDLYWADTFGGPYVLLTSTSELTYLDSALVNGQTYWYRVSAFSLIGEGPLTDPVGATPATTPSEPRDLAAGGGNAEISLSWLPPLDNGGAEVTSYVLYRSTSSGGIYSEIARPTGIVYRDTGLINGQTYWYKVSAVNAIGEGPMTNGTSATPMTQPSVPLNLQATPGNAQVVLNWQAPSDNGGSPVLGYKVYRSTSQGGVYLLVATPQNLSHTDTGLSNGQTYWYKVSAVNSAGESSMSVPASASPFTVPDAPTGVAATPGNGRVTLIWSAPFNGGRPIDYYVVYENGVALANHATELRMVISGLGNGINYTFSVAAHNLAGEGPQSSSVYAVPYTVPGEVTSLVANPGNEQVTLSWSTPLSDGGRPIDYYTVYRNGSALMNVVITNAWISGLTNGQTYGFTVSAHNVAGEGPMSPTVYAVPATVPTAPTGLTATPGNGTASLSWAASAYDGGRPIDYYIVYMDGTPLTEVTGTSVVVANLQNGRNYTFAVAAHNTMGASQLSIGAYAIPFTTASAPRSLEAAAGNSVVTLTWSAPLFNGGREIDHYVIYQDGVMLDANTSSLTVAISGLTNGRQYAFRVAAHNLAGTGTLSDAITAMPATVPSTPVGLTAATAVNKVTLTWQPPTYDGGMPLTGYTIYRNGVPVANVSAATLTWDDTNGTPGTSYRYAVGASNQEGMGLSSVEISASPQADNTWMLLLIIVVVIIVAMVAVLLMRKRRPKK